jgi:hypothetical protein
VAKIIDRLGSFSSNAAQCAHAFDASRGGDEGGPAARAVCHNA